MLPGHLGHAAVGQSVSAFIVWVPSVAANPAPLDPVSLRQGIEFAPEIHVAHRLSIAGHPAASLPAPHPLTDALLHILRIGMHDDETVP